LEVGPATVADDRLLLVRSLLHIGLINSSPENCGASAPQVRLLGQQHTLTEPGLGIYCNRTSTWNDHQLNIWSSKYPTVTVSICAMTVTSPPVIM